MLNLIYYPGCSLMIRAQELDRSARRVLSRLGIQYKELPSWNCCGGLISKLDFKSLIAPSRILISAAGLGDCLLTLCPFCYNTFKQANQMISQDSLVNRRINSFLESRYSGELKVIHLLELLKDYHQRISDLMLNPTEYKVACYYGCLLLRPRSIALDDPENPSLMQQLLSAIGCDPVDFPYANECCGSYLPLEDPGAIRIGARVMELAIESGAQVIATSCPLCKFNLEIASKFLKKTIAVMYFTQLLEWALVERQP